MLDTGATNSFLDDQIVRDLGLARSTSTTLIKIVNAKAAKVHGLAEATLELGPWKRACSLMILPLDDFQMILGLDFFRAAKGAIVPHLIDMFIGAEESLGFVPTIQHGALKAKKEAKKEAGELDSAKQIVHGVQEGHLTYVATLREIELEKMEIEVSAEVGEVPKALPPRRGHDHRIGHELGMRPPAKEPHRTAMAKFAEPHERLDEMLGAGMIQPSHAPLELSTTRRLEQQMAHLKPRVKEFGRRPDWVHGQQGHAVCTDTRTHLEQAGRAICSARRA